MLKIVRCGFSSGARDAFAREISALCDRGERAYLIVPEQQTVLAEGLMARLLPPSSALSFEVTNFTRFANTTFRSLGGLVGEYCDPAKKALIMWRTLTELAPTLNMTRGRGEVGEGMVESALAAVGEMQSLGISPSDLASVSGDEGISGDNRLQGKLSDLSSIYLLYKNILSKRYADTGDDAEVMIKKLRENPDFLVGAHIYVDGFTSFTEPQYRLLGLLAERCRVSVSLTLPKGREDAFEFSEIKECESRLVSTARKANADVSRVREEGNGANTDGALSEICLHLWSITPPKDNITLQNGDSLRIFEARTPYDECAFICDDIKRRVMGGASYSDFAIVARSAEDYLGILDSALDFAEIPAFTSYRRDSEEFEAVKLIYTAYAACRGFNRTDVISYAKCALSGVSREECDELEMYVNKWQINGRRFTDGEVWSMNPLGYTTQRDERTGEKLLRIDSIRHRIIDPLSAFAAASGRATTVREQAEALLSFLLSIKMEESLRKRAAYLAEMGEKSLADENASLWQVICRGLDTIVTVLGDLPCDRDAFLSQLKTVFSAVDIGRIPAYVDQVTVGSADMLRLYEKKHIYLIGVNDGRFPSTVTDRSYFTERDRARLKAVGLAISPEMELRGARELYIFSRAFSYARETVTISYSAQDTRFKATSPSEVVAKIGMLTGGAVKPVQIDNLSTRDRVYSPGLTLQDMGRAGEDYTALRDALVRSGYEREVRVLEGDISNTKTELSKEIVGRMAAGPMSLSQSRIDSYVGCPFGYFCKYTVRLGREERAEFDARSIGSFIHAILENFFTALSYEGRRSGDLTADERRELTRKAAEKYLSEIGEDSLSASVRTKIKIERLCRAALPVVDGLCDEFRQSAFEPRFFELCLSHDEGNPDPVKIKSDGGDINIYGIIDRVDAYKRGEDVFLRVIDYKTGQKVFSPSDLDEGANLQMFLYLKALVESDKESFRKRVGVGEEGRLIPAGVIYVKTNVSDLHVDIPDDSLAEKAVKEAQEREGMILDDPDSITAMTLKYTPVYSAKYPDEIRDNKRELLYSEEGWSDLMARVEGAVISAADGIRSGKMTSTPKNEGTKDSPCRYCEFKPICRKK